MLKVMITCLVKSTLNDEEVVRDSRRMQTNNTTAFSTSQMFNVYYRPSCNKYLVTFFQCLTHCYWKNKLACSKEQKWAPANKAGELLSEIRGSLTRSHPQRRSDVLLLRRSQLIGLFCYSSRSAAWHTNVKWENSMCKARWDANRKEELPPDEIQRGGNAYRIFWDWGHGWCLMPSQLCCC